MTDDIKSEPVPDIADLDDQSLPEQTGPQFTVETSPAEIQPGSEIVMTAYVASDQASALFHAAVLFRDADGAEIGRARLVDAPGGALRSEPVERVAPDDPGVHAFVAVIEDRDGEVLGEHAFTVTVAAHPIALTLWDVPPVVTEGAPFRVTLGLKCPCGCDARGWAWQITDATGAELAQGTTGTEPWTGTKGLFHSTVDLTAPAASGNHAWTVTALVPDHPVPHAARSQPLHLQVRPVPEVTLTIVAVDAATGAPVPRARVVAHPYRATTDAEGQATLRVPKGRYTVFVSGPPYFAYKSMGEITQDMTLTADMHVDKEFSDAEAWA